MVNFINTATITSFMKTTIIALTILFLLAGCTVQQAPVDNTSSNDVEENTQPEIPQYTPKTVTFVLTAESYKYVMDGVDNPDLVVKEGDTVVIDLTSSWGTHDWVIDEFNASTFKLHSPATHTIEFVAGKKGTFEYYSSVDDDRAEGMKGRFIVE